MYSDLFEHLGGGGGGGLSRAAANAAAASSGPPEDPRLVAFKAGKVRLQATDRGTYMCEADPTRGEVRLVASADGGGRLEWQWFDRRDNVVVDRRVVEQPPAVPAAAPVEGEEGKEEEAELPPSEGMTEEAEKKKTTTAAPALVHPSAWTFRKIDPPLPTRTHKDDRVYVFTHPPIITTTSGDGASASSDPHDLYDLYWMQDADPSHDDDLVEQVNQYLSDPAKAVAEATGGGTAAASGMGATGSLRAGGAGAAASTTAAASSSAQVDALSTILENLGMPQSSSSSSSESPPPLGGGTDATAAGAAPRNALTLADLQGAMAGIQQAQQQQQARTAPSISLSDVVTSDAVTSVLNDADARDRLLALLPEEQRTPELLEENLRSPQVRQTLRLLTQALLPDDDGRVDGFLSVVANFQLPSPPPSEGGGSGRDAQQALVVQASTNPIQAFLDAIVRSVQQEEEATGAAATGTSSRGDGDDAMDHDDEAKEP